MFEHSSNITTNERLCVSLEVLMFKVSSNAIANDHENLNFGLLDSHVRTFVRTSLQMNHSVLNFEVCRGATFKYPSNVVANKMLCLAL